jgi:hypothetical protein
MVLLQVGNGDGLQIWRLFANKVGTIKRNTDILLTLIKRWVRSKRREN